MGNRNQRTRHRQFILTIALALVLFVAGTHGAAAQDAAESPKEPVYQAHVLMPRDFAARWSLAEREAAWNVGLPVPDIVTTAVNVFDVGSPVAATSQHALLTADAGGWQPIYRQSFDTGFPTGGLDGACRVVTIANNMRYHWGSGTERTFDHTRAAATPLHGIVASAGTYPERALLQFVCIFDRLQDAQNLMVQFALWMDRGNDGDTFFAGVATDGQTFYGRRWRNTQPVINGDYAWFEQRIFAPFVGAETRAGGRVAVLWEFRSDDVRTSAVGAWLDQIVVERYVSPAHDVPSRCLATDSAIRVGGVPGDLPVSKGINISPYPVYTPSGLAGHVARLRKSGVNWVRMEWQAPVHLGDNAAELTGPASLLNYVDLKHYDTFLHLFCTRDSPIGALALLDYRTLPNQDWAVRGRIGDDYLEAWTAITELLVRYYQDRVGYWEIWNEPDFSATYLAPGDYARLLTATYTTIKQANAQAQVVFGGLSGIDWVTAQYFQQVVQLLAVDPVPYDVFAIHPYPSQEFRRAGQIIRDPSYLHFRSPTVLVLFMDIMRAAGHSPRPIWITEVGWNRAADSSDPSTLNCEPVYETMVTGPEQALYLPIQFDILFKETAWEPGVASVAKIFWYQYADVGLGISQAECQGWRRPSNGPTRVVDWWFGLYSGTDPARGIIEPQPNLAECTFRAYPDADAVNRCLSFDAAAGTLPDTAASP